MNDIREVKSFDFAEVAVAIESWEGEGGAPRHRWDALEVRQRLDWIKAVHSRMLGRGCFQARERIASFSSARPLSRATVQAA